jgi:DNA-binding transcriptional ArsR family regulator
MKTKDAVLSLTALAQESRLEVFRLLVPLGAEGLPAGRIAEQLRIPPATLTFHLKELTHAGLLESHREGRSIIYALRPEGIRGLMEFLNEDCCQGQPHLCQPRTTGSCGNKKTKKRPKQATTK